MNTQTPNGGPAFPTVFIEVEWGSSYGGMTLRDYFAGQALSSVLKSSGDLSTYYDIGAGSKGDNDIPSPLAIAKYSYALADAMLAEREGKSE